VDNVTALPCLLLGLDGFRLLAATEHGHELVLLVETTNDRDFCRTCGVRAGSKGRARTTVRDVPSGGRPTALVWKKRIWRCEQPECEAGSWHVARADGRYPAPGGADRTCHAPSGCHAGSDGRSPPPQRIRGRAPSFGAESSFRTTCVAASTEAGDRRRPRRPPVRPDRTRPVVGHRHHRASPAREGKVYFAVVGDVYSRYVVGWSIDAAQTAVLITNALGIAIDSRTPNDPLRGTLGSAERSTRAWSPRWARSAIAATTRSSSRSGPGCRSSFSTANAGRPGSNSPTRSSSTSRSSKTVSAATQRSACSHPSSSKLDRPAAQQHENPTTRLHQTRASGKPGADQTDSTTSNSKPSSGPTGSTRPAWTAHRPRPTRRSGADDYLHHTRPAEPAGVTPGARA
jgi:hypothetical protein